MLTWIKERWRAFKKLFEHPHFATLQDGLGLLKNAGSFGASAYSTVGLLGLALATVESPGISYLGKALATTTGTIALIVTIGFVLLAATLYLIWEWRRNKKFKNQLNYLSEEVKKHDPLLSAALKGNIKNIQDENGALSREITALLNIIYQLDPSVKISQKQGNFLKEGLRIASVRDLVGALCRIRDDDSAHSFIRDYAGDIAKKLSTQAADPQILQKIGEVIDTYQPPIATDARTENAFEVPPPYKTPWKKTQTIWELFLNSAGMAGIFALIPMGANYFFGTNPLSQFLLSSSGFLVVGLVGLLVGAFLTYKYSYQPLILEEAVLTAQSNEMALLKKTYPFETEQKKFIASDDRFKTTTFTGAKSQIVTNFLMAGSQTALAVTFVFSALRAANIEFGTVAMSNPITWVIIGAIFVVSGLLFGLLAYKRELKHQTFLLQQHETFTNVEKVKARLEPQIDVKKRNPDRGDADLEVRSGREQGRGGRKLIRASPSLSDSLSGVSNASPVPNPMFVPPERAGVPLSTTRGEALASTSTSGSSSGSVSPVIPQSPADIPAGTDVPLSPTGSRRSSFSYNTGSGSDSDERDKVDSRRPAK